jgi:hypothetical protein
MSFVSGLNRVGDLRRGDRLILRRCDTAREVIQERNAGAASVEAGNHIANGLIINASLAGESGSWLVGLVCCGINR